VCERERGMVHRPDAEEPASRLFAMVVQRSVKRRRGGQPESWTRRVRVVAQRGRDDEVGGTSCRFSARADRI